MPNITKRWLKKHNACDDAYEAFCAQNERDEIKKALTRDAVKVLLAIGGLTFLISMAFGGPSMLLWSDVGDERVMAIISVMEGK